MPLKIVRHDITKMDTEAIVNTANDHTLVGAGCDTAVYEAAGYDALLAYRKEKIGFVPEGEVFITPGFNLKAKYIIHAVSPLYSGGGMGEEEKLRSCYRKSLQLAKDHHIRSIAFPLISTGSFGYPKEEGLRIAVDEINAFLLKHKMDIYLVVFGGRAASLAGKIYPGLEEYIDENYVEVKEKEEYGRSFSRREKAPREEAVFFNRPSAAKPMPSVFTGGMAAGKTDRPQEEKACAPDYDLAEAAPHHASRVTQDRPAFEDEADEDGGLFLDFEEEHEKRLAERMRHLSDTFSQYLMFLIQKKEMSNAQVYKSAIVDKKIFSKIKNNVNYHPQKLTALCLCIGARLNLDEAKDLLSRAGYALSPCDKTDIIFSYFIENKIYDMIELDIQLEEHGLPCIIS